MTAAGLSTPARSEARMGSSEPTPVLEPGTALTLDRTGKSVSGLKKSTKKKLVRFPLDDCEFYSNIWDSPPLSTATSTPAQPKKYIDILQVAHALTMVDYKSDYMNPHDSDEPKSERNIWRDGDDEPADEAPLTDAQRVLSQESNRSRGPPTQYRTLQRLLSAQGGPSPRSMPVAPPTKHGSGRFIFSAVLSQLDMRDQWSSKFLLGLHEPVRHALYVIDRFLERANFKDTTTEWNTSTFFTWFGDHFCVYIQAQHHIKATVLRPLVQIKYASKKEIAECYEEITFMLDAIKMQEQLLQSTSDIRSLRRRLEGLQEDIRKLNVVLYHVLNLEERSLQPALIKTFNEDTFHRFVMPRVYDAARPKRLIIPWIIERSKVWGGGDDATMFKSQLSFPARFLYDRMWYPHFARHVVAAMKVLDTTMTEMAADSNDESWFGCSIQ